MSHSPVGATLYRVAGCATVRSMTTLFVAGKMGRVPPYNFPAFEAAEKWLKAAGYDVISPHRLDLELGFNPEVSLEANGFCMTKAMKRNVDAISVSDGVYMLDGWEKSDGARAEWAIARALGKPIYYQSNP